MPISISENPEGAVVWRSQRFGLSCLLDVYRHPGQRQLTIFMLADVYSRGFLFATILDYRSFRRLKLGKPSPCFQGFVLRCSCLKEEKKSSQWHKHRRLVVSLFLERRNAMGIKLQTRPHSNKLRQIILRIYSNYLSEKSEWIFSVRSLVAVSCM